MAINQTKASSEEGVPVVGEARIPVSAILQRLSEGVSVGPLIDSTPGLTRADVQEAIRIGADTQPIDSDSREILLSLANGKSWKSVIDEALERDRQSILTALKEAARKLHKPLIQMGWRHALDTRAQKPKVRVHNIPVTRAGQIAVRDILYLLAEVKVNEILDNRPRINLQSIRACVEYAEKITKDPYARQVLESLVSAVDLYEALNELTTMQRALLSSCAKELEKAISHPSHKPGIQAQAGVPPRQQRTLDRVAL